MVVGLMLALFGLAGFLGWTGDAQAMPHVFAQAPAAGLTKGDGCHTGGYTAIRVNRGAQERRCERSPYGCSGETHPKPQPQ